MSRAARTLVPAALGAVSARTAAAALRARPPGGAARWARTNYADRTVTLLGGAAVACAAGVVPLAAAGTRATGPGPALGAAAAVAAGGALGALDDLSEDTATARKGLRGHLGALAHGQITTGALKILGIGAGATVASVAVTPRTGRRSATALAVLGGAALVAGTANLHNLFDLRPGRALKVAAGTSGALVLTTRTGHAGTTHALAGGALGVAAAALPADLAEETMLGDTGANAVGALVGCALAAHPSPALRTGALSVVVALTLLSERVSFSRVIATTPVLRELDAWGRR